MEIALAIVLIVYLVQSIAKFAIGFTVPYDKRIRRIAAYYAKNHRVISIYDDVTLLVVAALVVLQFAVGMEHLSFLTGLLVGMLMMQVFVHRFIRPLPEDRMPKPPYRPIEVVSYAIQAQPALAWKEVLIMAALSGWGLYALVAYNLIG